MIFKKNRATKLEELATSATMAAQRQRLKQLKQALVDDNASLNKSTEETIAVIAQVSEKLKSGLKKLDQSIGLFTTMKDEGVAFIDFRGDIIHVNHAAAELLNRPITEIIGKRIDHILTGSRRRKISIADCSQLIISKVKADDGESTYGELCDTARTAYLLKTQEVAMHLDEPVCIVLRSGDSIHPLKVTISLLDTQPKELEDVTFLCKIAQIAGSPAPVYEQAHVEI